MQACDDLLVRFRQRGVKLWAEDGQLRFSAPKGTLTTDDFTALRAGKDRLIALLEESELAAGIPFRARSSQGPFPLTALQARQWKYTTERRAGRSERTCIVAQRVTGPFDRGILQEALQHLCLRHESLRLRIVQTDSGPLQQLSEFDCSLESIDLQGAAQPCAAASRLCEDFATEPVDLHGGSLFAAKLFKLSADEHVLLILMHHMVSDAVSCQIVAKEVWDIYSAAAQGVQAQLPCLAFQFPDYAEWQHRTRRAWLTTHASYWTSHLANLAATERATRLAELPPIVFAKKTVALDDALSTGIRELARTRRKLTSVVVLAIYVAAIGKWLRLHEFVLAFVTNARDRAELQNVVGFVADYLHLRIRIQDGEAFSDLLQRLAIEFNAACAHQDYGRVPDLVPECRPEVGFNWLPGAVSQDAPGQQHLAADTRPYVQPFPLRLAFPLPPPRTISTQFRDSPASISVTVAYRPDVFTPESVDEFNASLQAMMQEVVQAHTPD